MTEAANNETRRAGRYACADTRGEQMNENQQRAHVMQKNQGFTMIELVVVIAILGILAALVVPQVMSRPDQAKVTVAKGDIKAVAAALDMYKLDNFAYPSTQQGLEALVKKPSGNPQPKNWNRDGYLKRLPKDPWGNDYQYLSPGTQGQFDLYSFGADGKPGGSDLNADIGNWDL